MGLQFPTSHLLQRVVVDIVFYNQEGLTLAVEFDNMFHDFGSFGFRVESAKSERSMFFKRGCILNDWRLILARDGGAVACT